MTSISVKRSSFTLVFLKAAYHANPGAETNFEGSIYTFFKVFKYIN